MNCPYCQASLSEGVSTCNACGFALDRVESHFGPLPTITSGINDPRKTMNWRERHRLSAGIHRFQRRFPQLRFHLAIFDLDPKVPIAAYNFWLFNHSPLCSEIEKGSLNFHLLLLIDDLGRRANLMIGYGLEPFVSNEDLTQIVAVSRDAINRGDFADAALAVLESTTQRFMEICEAIPTTYGLESP